ncbi:MAG: helix-turn-helix domain-containing protein [Candidatus Symbiopectobacterium sp. Dall1.0]|nr:helix-turn-helix domain-containing protein [Candidatus Symbiopectobacterium sp. Dall1.0]
MKTTLSERLIQAMSARNISQGALAKAAGIAQPTIWRLVKGQAKGSTKLVDIANALSVNVEWLANGSGHMDSSQGGRDLLALCENATQTNFFPVELWSDSNRPTGEFIYAPNSIKSETCQAYILKRNSGCAEAPAGTIIIVDIDEQPGNGDLVYAHINGGYSVYRFVEGGAMGFLSVDDKRVPLLEASSGGDIIGVVVFLLRDLKRRK